MSAPNANSAVPKIKSRTPTANKRNVPVSKGVNVRDSPNTMSAMGKTA